MDRLDVRIFRLLLSGKEPEVFAPDFRRSYRAMARELGVDEGTVRNRVKGMHDSGFIRAWRIWLNPYLWGGGEAGVWFDVPGTVSRSDLVEKLALIPGIVFITTFVESMMTLLVRYDEEGSLRQRMELVRKLSQARGFHFGELWYPECHVTLRPWDLKMLRILDEDPRMDYRALAERLGLSPRTVRRRLRALMEERAMFAFPVVDFRALRGAVMASLMVVCPVNRKGEVLRGTMDRLEPRLWHSFHMRLFDTPEVVACVFNVLLPNVSRAREILRWAREIPAADTCRIDLYDDATILHEPFDEFTERGLERRLAGSR